MQTFFTHTPRPLRPLGRSTLFLLPFLLFLLLPALAFGDDDTPGTFTNLVLINQAPSSGVDISSIDWMAPAPGYDQVVAEKTVASAPTGNFAMVLECIEDLNAGPNKTWCEGELATLDGGYVAFNNPGTQSDPGTVTATWSVVDGSQGDLIVGGNNEGDSFSAENFSYSGNGNDASFPVVFFQPADGVTGTVELELTASTTNTDCDASNGTVQFEEVTLFFDPIRETPLDVTLAGPGSLDDATGNTGNTVNLDTGDEIDVEIDETNTIDNSAQCDDLAMFDVTVDAPGVAGLPAGGIYSESDFDFAFRDLILTNTTCGEATATITVFHFFERDLTDNCGDGTELGCDGPPTVIEFVVAPRPDVIATLGFAVDEDVTEAVVCADDDMIQVFVTGTPNTTISYTLDFGNGPGAEQTLDLDATGVNGTDILLDAEDIETGDEILIVLTGGEYQDAPECPQEFSKPLTITVEPLPTLELEFFDPADEVQCFGTNFFEFVVTTTSGPGTYTFDLDLFFDGVEVDLDGGTGPDFGNFTTTIGPSGTTLLNVDLTTFGSDGTLEIRLNGASITKDGLNGLACTNPAPDASLSFFLQADSFVEYEATVDAGTPNAGPTQSLTEDNTSLDLVICDGQRIDFDQTAPLADNSVIDGITGALEILIEDHDNLLGFGQNVTLFRDFKDNPFEFDQAFDIPNNQTTSSTITVTATPYFEEDGNQGLTSGDECSGDPVVLNIEVRPAPTVEIEVSDELVCSGDDVTVTITASEPGTATLFLGEGGAGTEYTLVDDGAGGGIIEILFEDITEETMFSVNTFTGTTAGCSAILNLWALTKVEENPEAEIGVENDALCLGDETTVTLAGSGGAENGYSFDVSVEFVAPNGGSASAIQTTYVLLLPP